ncbi:MAG: phosphopyruvate hydratase [Candidatus Bathyarchaeia archaeon]|nr:phosphopyruvate hydratase [Candidatus Bathyarchaeota archaeon]
MPDYTIIEDIRARKVFDSRGNPTVEVEIYTRGGGVGRVSAPAGASTGKWEVIAYPPGGVDEALKILKDEIAPRLIGMDSEKQEEIDAILKEIDGSPRLSHIGGNTAYAISIANALAAASSYDLPLFMYLGGRNARYMPYPVGNILGGGKHAGAGCPDIQEFLSIPLGAKNFMEAAQANILAHKNLRNILERENIPFFGGKGDEGAWAPAVSDDKAFEYVAEAIEKTSDEIGFEVRFGVDVASSSFWREEEDVYFYKHGGKKLTTGEQIDFIVDKIKSYRLIYVEDPLHEEDFEGFRELTSKVRGCFIVGDDLFVTNIERLKKGVSLGAANALIIKPNQVGTISDTIATVEYAHENLYTTVFSHRSGETESVVLAHLAVGLRCPFVKLGVVGGERIAKINELIRIEEYLGSEARMAKVRFR